MKKSKTAGATLIEDLPADISEDIPAEASTAIERVVADNPGLVLVDRQKRDELYDHIRREVDSFVPDLTTETGRKAIASLAYKVARTKTALDDAGAELKADWLVKSQAVDKARREIREQLDELRDRARKPLTEWEDAEAKRQEECTRLIETLKAAPNVALGETADAVRSKIAVVESLELTLDTFLGLHAAAEEFRQKALETLRAVLARIEQEERDREELVRLRAEREAKLAASLATPSSTGSRRARIFSVDATLMSSSAKSIPASRRATSSSRQ